MQICFHFTLTSMGDKGFNIINIFKTFLKRFIIYENNYCCFNSIWLKIKAYMYKNNALHVHDTWSTQYQNPVDWV